MSETKSQEVIKKAGIIQRLSLAEKIISDDGRLKGTRSTGKHKVKFLEDKVINGKDFQTGQERLEMKYIFDEDGVKKFYTRPLRDDKGEVYYFIQKMANFNYGDELILEYIPKGKQGYIDVRLANRSDSEEKTQLEASVSPTSDFIPVVEEGEIPTQEALDEIFGPKE